MAEQETTLQVLVITLPGRRAAVDKAEIVKVVSGREYRTMLAEYQSRGDVCRLEDLAGTAAGRQAEAALIVRVGRGARFVSFTGTSEERTISTDDIIPLPEYLRRKQDPFVAWGFLDEPEGRGGDAPLLVTFQFLPEKGSA